MPWKEVSVREFVESHGGDYDGIREKHRLIELIVKARKKAHLSQASLAKKVGVTQGRIAQIETGIGTTQVTYDILLGILKQLGYECRIVAKKAS